MSELLSALEIISEYLRSMAEVGGPEITGLDVLQAVDKAIVDLKDPRKALKRKAISNLTEIANKNYSFF